NSVQTSVVIVKPGGTGRPMLAISARFAPLPPSRFFISFVPSAFPPPKKNVRFATFPAFLRIAVLALTLTPFLWPFLSATFLGFSDLDLVLARLGMGAHIPRPGAAREGFRSRTGRGHAPPARRCGVTRPWRVARPPARRRRPVPGPSCRGP